MGRRRGTPIHGWMIIDKPDGMTSAAVVNRVRKLTNAAKVGHGGTLDPMATGVLPIALGEATKTVAYVMDGRKSYRFRVRWGQATETDDAEGAVTDTSDSRPDRPAIEEVLAQFRGPIEQIPPAYSAVKVEGRRAYDLARQDQDVKLEPRTVEIHRIELAEIVDADHADFIVESGKGAYMRGLARDIARALGTYGHIAALRRTSVGPFAEADAISLDRLEELGHSAPSSDYVLPVETALDGIPALALTEAEARRLRSGQPLPVLPVASRNPKGSIRQGAIVCAMDGPKLAALARIEGGEIRPVRVMNL